MRHLSRARRAGVLTIAATAGALAVAGPALAGPASTGVTVDPPSAPQASGANLYFKVVNTEKSAITRVLLTVPADTPIAEVYPLSVPDWAPDITQQRLTTPLETIHGGTPVTEVTKQIAWIAMPGKGIAPGASAELGVSLGPLPTLSEMHFDVAETYADGHAGPALPPVVLKLTPATAAQLAAGHAGHDAPGEGTAGNTDPDSALFAQTVAAGEHGTSIWSIGGWVLAALLGLGGIWAALRNRHRSEPTEEDEGEETEEQAGEQDPDAEPVGAGSGRRSNWRYSGGPG